jgi:hypothetical protein
MERSHNLLFEVRGRGEVGSARCNEEGCAESEAELPTDFDHHSARWRTAHFRPGDVVVFDIRSIHASTPNLSDCFRISLDTRWQPEPNIGANMKSIFKTFRIPP